MNGGPLPQSPAQAGPSPRNLPAQLLRLHQESYSGTVMVSGVPGGTIHLRDGLIGAIETPGTPSVESALLKSARISDEHWAAALTAARQVDDLGATLVHQGRVGAAELEVLCAATVFEGAFAMALARPDGWEVGGPAPTVLTRHGIAPQTVAEETTRRLALVSQRWGSPAELARAKMRPSSRADRVAGRLTRRYQAVLAVANARRTPRDLAFTLGRGLFAVMVDLIHMNDLQLIQWEDPPPAHRPSTAPRAVEAGAAARTPAGSLPRRVPRGRPEHHAHSETRAPDGPRPSGLANGSGP